MSRSGRFAHHAVALALAAVVLPLVLAGCTSSPPTSAFTADSAPQGTRPDAPRAVVSLSPSSRPPPPPQPSVSPSPLLPPAPYHGIVTVSYRLEVRTSDVATQGFPATVEQALTDPQGWAGAGFRLERREDAEFLLVIAEGPQVDELCRPWPTRSTYSCHNEGTVAINADRWRTATPQFTGDLPTYRRYLVNHEVGHLLGQPHVDCPAPGLPSPVMVQQSTELDGCLPNGLPLPDELVTAARDDRPLAPPPP